MADDLCGDVGEESFPGVLVSNEPVLINNADHWPTGAVKYRPAMDLAVCLLGLAANITLSLHVFLADVRRDLALGRNHGLLRESVGQFDADLAGLPQVQPVAPPEQANS